MMDRPLGVAVIGCGWAGRRHAQAFMQSGAIVRWAIDTDQRRAAALPGLPEDGRTATDCHAALADPAVDAVTVCLPHNLHAPVTVEAAQAGKHVLCEKPLAHSLEAADRMIAAAEQAGVTLMVAENERFNPLFHKVRELLDEGVIGQIALIQMTREVYTTRESRQERPWYNQAQAAAGGIMMSGGVHDVETMRMLVGEIEGVFAFRARQRLPEMEGDDTSVALVRFRDGSVGTLVESFLIKSLTTASGPEVHTLRIDGDLGSIAVRDGRTIRLFSERADLQRGGALTEHHIYMPEADTFVLEIEHFLHAVRTGEEPLTSGRSQRRPLEVVLAAYQSMASGHPVTLL